MPTQSIAAPVGALGVNRTDDVRAVQQLLNAARLREPRFRDGPGPLVVDGRAGPVTIGAIRRFQEQVLGWQGPAVDATIHPGRATWRRLNGNVASVTAVAPVRTRPAVRVGAYRAFRQGAFTGAPLGDGTLFIPGHGCALCTLTMAATAIGARTEHWPAGLAPADLDPLAANGIIRRAGGFSGSSLVMATAAAALGMTYEEYGRGAPLAGNALQRLDQHLGQGLPVAGHVDYKSSAIGDHWVLITRRFLDARYQAIDPATGGTLSLTAAPQCLPGQVGTPRTESLDRALLFGWGQGGSAKQQQYALVRFGLLGSAGGDFGVGG